MRLLCPKLLIVILRNLVMLIRNIGIKKFQELKEYMNSKVDEILRALKSV